MLSHSVSTKLVSQALLILATLAMLIGGCVGGVVWLLAAMMVLKTTAQSFTMSVRRLAGLD